MVLIAEPGHGQGQGLAQGLALAAGLAAGHVQAQAQAIPGPALGEELGDALAGGGGQAVQLQAGHARHVSSRERAICGQAGNMTKV